MNIITTEIQTQSELIQIQLKIFDELEDLKLKILELKLQKEILKDRQADINDKLAGDYGS